MGVWDTPDEINFEKLPNKFVLKCNHNSGVGLCICHDKNKLNISKVKKDLSRGLRQNFIGLLVNGLIKMLGVELLPRN